MKAAQRERRWPGYLVAAALALVSSGLSLLSPRYLSLADAAILHLLSVVLIATRFGAGPAIMSALIGVAGFDFILPPSFEFTVADMGHFVTLGVMIFVSILVSGLTEQLRRERQRARRSEERTLSLYALERALSGADSDAELAGALVEQVCATLPVEPLVLLAAGSETLAIDRSGPRAPSAEERGVFYARLDDPAGDRKRGHFLIGRAGESAGVLRVLPVEALIPEECELVEALTQRLSSAIARKHLAHEAEAARLDAQVERVRAALLSSVSHDLRTPLATISASAQMLRRTHNGMDAALRGEILAGIADEAGRLDVLLRNLLAMTQVEAGKLQPRLLPASVDEAIASTLRRLDERLLGRTVVREAQPHLPLVNLDVPLLEQALINVLENAIRYSPEGTPLTIGSHLVGGQVEVTVRDSGLGIDAAETEVVFEKFRRGSNAPRSDGGVGLGLTICRAILQAHNGTISLSNAPGGGTIASLRLPPTQLALRDAEEHLPSFA